jgi:3-oxoacyl-[acyl-carrier-protein] synthase II
MQNLRRVVVTGIGALTPIGNNLKDYWNALVSGTSGAAMITKFDASQIKAKFACEIKKSYPEDYLDKKEIRTMDLCSIYAVIACTEAVSDSSIIIKDEDPYRVGVIWGTGIGGLESSSISIIDYSQCPAPKKINPYFIPKMIANMPAGHIAMKFNIKGPNHVTVSACTSSNHAIIDAATAIMMGQADVMVTGGSEAAITEIGISGFSIIKAISERNDSPATASRPFDKDRDGFVMGEGAGALILESYDHAIKRGAKIYAEIGGFASTSDAYHVTAPDPEGHGIAKATSLAMKYAGVSSSTVDYINLHGTSTIIGDLAEMKGLEKAFGEDIYNPNLSSTKSMTGHLLGAAGAIESIACIMAINSDTVPPTINHFTHDEAFNSKINFTFNTAQKRNIDVAINNTSGFGGHNTSLVFKKIIA